MLQVLCIAQPVPPLFFTLRISLVGNLEESKRDSESAVVNTKSGARSWCIHFAIRLACSRRYRGLGWRRRHSAGLPGGQKATIRRACIDAPARASMAAQMVFVTGRLPRRGKVAPKNRASQTGTGMASHGRHGTARDQCLARTEPWTTSSPP